MSLPKSIAEGGFFNRLGIGGGSEEKLKGRVESLKYKKCLILYLIQKKDTVSAIYLLLNTYVY